MLLTLLYSFSAYAGPLSSAIKNKVMSQDPCLSVDCLSLREEDTEHIFPPDFRTLTNLSGVAEAFDIEGSLLGYPVSLVATMLESDQSVAAYGSIDLGNDGHLEGIGLYLDATATNTWSVTAYLYSSVGGTYTGKVTGQLVYASWGNSTNPLNGWELRNATTTLARGYSAAYSASNIALSFDGLIGDNVYYYSSTSQSSGTNSVVEYLYLSAGGSHYSGYSRSGNIGLLITSSQDQVFNMGGSSGDVTYIRSLTGTSLALSGTEDLYQPTTRTTTTTIATRTYASISTKVYSYVSALTTLYSSYTWGSLVGAYVPPTTTTGTGAALLDPLY